MRAKRSFICCILILFTVFSVFAQSDGWYYDKPIRYIKVTGLHVVSGTTMNTVVSEFLDKNFSDDIYMDIINKIYDLDYFNDISVEVDPADEYGNSLILRIEVQEKPVVSKISVNGNKQIYDTEITNSISQKKGELFAEAKLPSDERKIRDMYLEKGYTDVRVSSSYVEGDSGIEVTYSVVEGKSTVVTAIRFEGNQVFSERTLKGQLSLKESGLFNKGAYRESILETDKATISAYYQERGYMDAGVVDVKKEVTVNEAKNQDEMIITFVLEEGDCYTYGGMTLSGNTIFTTEELLSFIKINEGDVFNMTKFNTGVYSIANKYYENGYTSNSFSNPAPTVDQENHVVSFAMTIVERPRSHFENIILSGNTKTKDNVIRRELGIETGDIYSLSKLQTGLRNLANTQFFSSVTPDFTPGSEENLLNMVLNLEEGSTTSVEAGVAFSGISDSSEMPVSVFMKWSDTNVAGTGKTISAGLNISSSEIAVNAGYSDSWLFNEPISVSANLEYSRATTTCPQVTQLPSELVTVPFYMDYLKRTLAASVSLGRRWQPNSVIFTLLGGLGSDLIRNDYDDSLFTPSDAQIRASHESFGLSNSVWISASMDDRDIYYDPTSGWFASQKFIWTGLIPGVENQFYLKSETKAEIYHTLFSTPFSEVWDFSIIFAGLTNLSFMVPGGNTEISSGNKLFIDGIFNGRGWDSLAKNKGTALWNTTLEFRVPISIGVFGVDFFADAVALKDDLKAMFTDLSIEDFRFSFGPGIRFSIPQFPIRLLLANTFQIKDGAIAWDDYMKFTISFTIANR